MKQNNPLSKGKTRSSGNFLKSENYQTKLMADKDKERWRDFILQNQWAKATFEVQTLAEAWQMANPSQKLQLCITVGWDAPLDQLQGAVIKQWIDPILGLMPEELLAPWQLYQIGNYSLDKLTQKLTSAIQVAKTRERQFVSIKMEVSPFIVDQRPSLLLSLMVSTIAISAKDLPKILKLENSIYSLIRNQATYAHYYEKNPRIVQDAFDKNQEILIGLIDKTLGPAIWPI